MWFYLFWPKDKKWLVDIESSSIDPETWGVAYAEPNLPISNLTLNPLGFTPVEPKDMDWLLANTPSGIAPENWEVLSAIPNFTTNLEAEVSNPFYPNNQGILTHLAVSGNNPDENI